MTRPDDVSALWILGELWGGPPEVSSSLTDEENLDYAKALYCIVDGDGRMTDAEREWILGYAHAAGNCEHNCDAMRAFDGDETVEDYFTRGKQPIATRVCISDAIRACASDGDLEPHERETIHRMAGRLDIPAEVVDELVDIHRQEQALKLRRIQLAFPDGMVA